MYTYDLVTHFETKPFPYGVSSISPSCLSPGKSVCRSASYVRIATELERFRLRASARIGRRMQRS